MHLSPFLRRFWRDERGNQLVEFALVLPLMLLVFVVIVDGGRMLWSYQATNAAVRDAARYLARVVPSDVCAVGGAGVGAVTGLSSKVDSIVKQSAAGSAVFPEAITINSVTPALNCVTGNYRAGRVGIATVTAEVEMDFPLNGVFTLLGMARPPLTTRVTEQSRIFGT